MTGFDHGDRPHLSLMLDYFIGRRKSAVRSQAVTGVQLAGYVTLALVVAWLLLNRSRPRDCAACAASAHGDFMPNESGSLSVSGLVAEERACDS